MTSLSLKTLLKPLSAVVCSIAACSAVALFAALPAISQTAAQAATSTAALQPRITTPIDNSRRATLAGSRPPRANPADDIGAVPSSMKLQGISLVFSRSAAQQAALDNLVAAQQDPTSPLYHHWLTPDQFAAQFGVADADIAAVETWLEQQGFSVDSVSRSRNRIYFSGTAAQVASAFGASLHYYQTPAIGNQTATMHFAPSADLTIPAALASSVLAIENLSSFRPHAHVKIHAPQAQPRFTSSQTGANFLTPGDVSTIYNVSAATGAGYTGTGQTIVIIGQSAIETSDITNFQTAAGLPNKLPTLILMPGTGSSTINPGGSKDNDEVESDLDLEYSGAIAQGATIDFIYTGSNTYYGAFDALEYAIDEQGATVTTTSGASVPFHASIISSSYGDCETDLGSSNYNSLNAALEQAATQGQTVIAAAGDDGSTDCNGEVTSKSEEEALAVDFPASSQYVTGIGGTEFLLADIAPGSPYFDTQSSTDIISSAKSYIPEQVWNDDAGDGSLSSGGGGVSSYTPRPIWQTGVPGIPSSGNRLVPDISLYASPGEPDVAASTSYGGYLYCSSDSTYTGVTGSCTNGFRDANNEYLTVAGGTSFGAPIFSGMLAILNQARGYTSSNGQGVINPTLYTLAANAATYASAFHDITVGGNQCLAGATYCGTGPQTADYVSTTGYDEASGLGSVDLYNLLTAWTTGTSTPFFILTATNASVAPGASATGTITITPANGYTGTVNLSVNYTSLTDGCIIFNPTSATVTGTAAVTASYTVYTSTSACTTEGAISLGPQKSAALNSRTAPHQPKSPWKQLPIPATLAGTFLLVCFRRRSRLLRASMALGLLLALSFSGLGLTGCSGSSTSTNNSSSPPPTNTPAGTYTITLTGTDSVTSTITNSTTFTVTVN
jgi:subtilase family serine protease